MTYGYELILDLHACDVRAFTRKNLDNFFTGLCELIQMEKCVVHFWDDVDVAPEDQQTLLHTKGTSAVCFILTSSIVIHTLDLLAAVYVNIFSCKAFDSEAAAGFTQSWFKAESCSVRFVERI
jgi:S-adenosylmethionine decarboxylase